MKIIKGEHIAVALLMAVLITALSASVWSADEMYLNESFSGTTADLAADGWEREISGSAAIEVADGALHLSANGTNALHRAKKDIEALPSEYYFEFRVMRNNDANSPVCFNLYGGTTRVFLQIRQTQLGVRGPSGFTSFNAAHETGKWYHYLIRVYDNCKYADIYRQAEEEMNMAPLASRVELQAVGGTRLEVFIENNAEISGAVDDIRVYSPGLWLASQGFYSGEQPVTALPNGVLLVTADLVYGNVGGGDQPVTAVLALFDKNDKMVDRVTQTLTLPEAGGYALRMEIDTAPFYNELAGGCARLFLWDGLLSMQPLTPVYQLNQ